MKFWLLIFLLLIPAISPATEHILMNLGNSVNRLQLGDMDQDGDLDIVVSNSPEGAWFENDGLENFVQHTLSDIGPTRIALGDLTRDGDFDIAVASFLDAGSGWLENAAGQIIRHILPENPNGLGAYYLPIVDLDQDGDNDVLGALSGSDQLTGVVWWENDGTGQFQYHQINSRRHYEGDSGDVDHDGDMDFVLSGAYESYGVTLYYNDGTQNFTPITVGSSCYETEHVVFFNPDMDDDEDLLYPSEDGITFSRNLGNQSWSDSLVSSWYGWNQGNYVATDYNLNGRGDVIWGSSTFGFSGFFGNATGNVTYDFPIIPDRFSSAFDLADLDQDGDQDVVFVDSVDPSHPLIWWENHTVDPGVLRLTLRTQRRPIRFQIGEVSQFTFEAVVVHQLEQTRSGQIWCTLRRENGPANLIWNQPITLQAATGQCDTLSTSIRQHLPEDLPAGTYEYTVSMGHYPQFVADSYTLPIFILDETGHLPFVSADDTVDFHEFNRFMSQQNLWLVTGWEGL